MRVRITRSARKHRISNGRILTAMVNAGRPETQGDRLIYVGPDHRGVDLLVVALPDDKHPGSLAVIHVSRWPGTREVTCDQAQGEPRRLRGRS